MPADQVLKKDKHVCASVLQVLHVVSANTLEKSFIFIHCYIHYSSLLYSTLSYSPKEIFHSAR